MNSIRRYCPVFLELFLLASLVAGASSGETVLLQSTGWMGSPRLVVDEAGAYHLVVCRMVDQQADIFYAHSDDLTSLARLEWKNVTHSRGNPAGQVLVLWKGQPCLVWAENAPDDSAIFFQCLGQLKDFPFPQRVRLSDPGDFALFPSAAARGNDLVVTWTVRGGAESLLEGVRLDAGLASVESFAITNASGTPWRSTVAIGPDRLALVGWESASVDGVTGLRFATVDLHGETKPGVPSSPASLTGEAVCPWLAATPSGGFLCLYIGRSEGWRPMAMALDPASLANGAAPLALGPAAPKCSQLVGEWFTDHLVIQWLTGSTDDQPVLARTTLFLAAKLEASSVKQYPIAGPSVGPAAIVPDAQPLSLIVRKTAGSYQLLLVQGREE